MSIGDYEKVGWSPTNLQPVNGFNLQKVDVKLDEVDKMMSNIIQLKGEKGDKGEDGINEFNQNLNTTDSPTFNIVNAALNGNASSATKLAASVNINGTPFDGSSNITITAAPTTHSHGDATITDVAWSKVSNKPDPTITLTGAVTGSGTLNDLASVSIATTVNHNHDTVYYTETELKNLTDQLVQNILNSYPGTIGVKIMVNPISGNTITKTA